MAYNGQPTITRKILGRRLAKAREAAGLTIEQVSAKTNVSTTTIYRQESGHVAVKVTMIPYFAKLYGVEDEATQAQWETWARLAKTRGPWATSGSTVGPSYRDYAEAEDMARVLRMWQLGVIPGLLQTRRYSEEVIASAATVLSDQPEDEEIAALMQLREIRKAILERDNPPRVWAVIGEAAILTPPSVTDKDSHREQIQHLLNLGETKVTIQVLPMATGLHGGLSGSFSIIELTDLTLAFKEGYGDGTFVDDEERVQFYRDRFERLVMQAMSVTDTRRYLHERLGKI